MRDGGAATGGMDAGHEPLAAPVLLELEVHAREPGQDAVDGTPTLAAARLEPPADGGHVRDELGADLVHDPVAEALHEAHDRLRLAEQGALLGAQEAAPGTLRGRGAPAARQMAQPMALQVARLLGEERHLALQPLAQVGTQPGMCLELEGVRRLVQADPQPEGVQRAPRRRGRWTGCSPRRRAAGREPARPRAAPRRTGRAPGCRGSPTGTPPGWWSGGGWSRPPVRSARLPFGPRGIRLGSRCATRAWKVPRLAAAHSVRLATAWRSTTPGNAAPSGSRAAARRAPCGARRRTAWPAAAVR